MVPAKSPFEDPNLPPPPALPPKSGTTMAHKFANAFRRQTSDDKAKKRAKDKRMQDEINKTTAKASRMDIIDRLDLSGINGSSSEYSYEWRSISLRSTVLCADHLLPL